MVDFRYIYILYEFNVKMFHFTKMKRYFILHKFNYSPLM